MGLEQIPSVDQGSCTQDDGRGENGDAQTLGSQALTGNWFWRLSSGRGERRCPARSLCPAVRLLGWLPGGLFPVREAWGHCFCNHRHTGVLPVAPSEREATEQILKVGIALGASWPQEGMSSCDQEACALELPAPRACCLQTHRDQGIVLCFPMNGLGSQAQTGSLQNQTVPGTVACQARWPRCAGSLTLAVLALLACHFTTLCSQNGGGKGRANCSLCSPRMLRAWSLAGGCEMCLGGNGPALHPLFVSSKTPCPHSGPLPSSARPGEPCAGIQLLQRRWPGISKQGSEGAGAVRGELGGESVVTPGSPEITGACKAAPGRWEANATYKVPKHDG